MDTAFKTAAFSGFTTDQLRKFVRDGINTDTARAMEAEIERREAVKAGNMNCATQGERLRYARRTPEERLVSRR